MESNKFVQFLLRYKITIVIGLVFAVYVAMSPIDYTADVDRVNGEIAAAEDEIKEKESAFTSDVEEHLTEKMETAKETIETLTVERDKLAKQKDELQVVYDAQVEKEEEAKRKEEEKREQEEEQARLEEEERKAGKWILESSGYNVWEAYFTPGTYKVIVEHDGNQYGSGNVIVYAGDKVDQEQILVINEIGMGTFAGTFKVASEGYYTLTFETDGGFSFEYGPL